MKQRHLLIIYIAALVFMLMFQGCATIQQRMEALTPDQQARVTLKATQDQLENLWDTALNYYAIKGAAGSQEFETIVRPAFQVAWSAYDAASTEFEKTVKNGGVVSVADIVLRTQNLMHEILLKLAGVGVPGVEVK